MGNGLSFVIDVCPPEDALDRKLAGKIKRFLP